MKKLVVWFLAFIITAASAVYQRRTGPTYHLRGKVEVAGTSVKYELPRSAETSADCKVDVAVAAPEVTGKILYKRFKTSDAWAKVSMARQDGRLVGLLPKQPAAGKLDYRVVLTDRGQDVSLTGEKPVIIRFKDHVPLGVLLAHVIVMFGAMLLSTRAGLAALDKKDHPRLFGAWTLLFLFVGGFVLGPLVQRLAFGAWWTGVPLGWDLTDNKTLIALVIWIIAMVAGRKGPRARGWILAASVIMLVIFLIPHSLLGSELKYPEAGR
ncbi:MAG: hypothetical protein A2W03_03650 [Candidatus Aminicenantes bacterium RBG_16_63_16]|nr:MAG: hypothetical protein A2W03_03650 [Candidatus Aminicenantes bacterium RBG_16_63_16]